MLQEEEKVEEGNTYVFKMIATHQGRTRSYHTTQLCSTQTHSLASLLSTPAALSNTNKEPEGSLNIFVTVYSMSGHN